MYTFCIYCTVYIPFIYSLHMAGKLEVIFLKVDIVLLHPSSIIIHHHHPHPPPPPHHHHHHHHLDISLLQRRRRCKSSTPLGMAIILLSGKGMVVTSFTLRRRVAISFLSSAYIDCILYIYCIQTNHIKVKGWPCHPSEGYILNILYICFLYLYAVYM